LYCAQSSAEKVSESGPGWTPEVGQLARVVSPDPTRLETAPV